MISFLDCATNEQIPYHNFEANPSKMVCGLASFSVITGLAATVIGVVCLSIASAPTTGAYVTASLGMASGMLISAISITNIYLQIRNLQKLPLPAAGNIDQYRTLLDIDENNRYGYTISNVIDDSYSIRGTETDFGRDIYCFEGKELQTIEELKQKVPQDIQRFLHQWLPHRLLCVLAGRYHNGDLEIVLSGRGTLYDVFQRGGKWYIRVEQLFKFLNLGEIYLHSKLLVDVETRTGRLTWKSPQTQMPTFA